MGPSPLASSPLLGSNSSGLTPIFRPLSPPGVAAVGAGREPDLSPTAALGGAVRESSSPASALLLDQRESDALGGLSR